MAELPGRPGLHQGLHQGLDHDLTDGERVRFERDGYLVRTGVFGADEVDASAYPDVDPVPVEVEAGSTVSFGSLLVHQSTANTSDLGRRALLFSYQPAGGTTMVDSFRRLGARRGATG